MEEGGRSNCIEWVLGHVTADGEIVEIDTFFCCRAVPHTNQ